jgi:hypothetical protein
MKNRWTAVRIEVCQGQQFQKATVLCSDSLLMKPVTCNLSAPPGVGVSVSPLLLLEDDDEYI